MEQPIIDVTFGPPAADIFRDRQGWNVFRNGCPGGEAAGRVGGRADRLIAKLSAAKGDMALFSHGEFDCVLAARWIALPPADGQHFSLGPASLSILCHRPGHPKVRSVALWNASEAGSAALRE